MFVSQPPTLDKVFPLSLYVCGHWSELIPVQKFDPFILHFMNIIGN